MKLDHARALASLLARSVYDASRKNLICRRQITRAASGKAISNNAQISFKQTASFTK